ncbi:hypothetical protein H8356DRAFT_1675979 [Neocallimastix lanati (nom. inval.)]|nr:hypothetical protein H8356DRAFT_1675979 [Neocallimastix sp. JGI-2020a]
MKNENLVDQLLNYINENNIDFDINEKFGDGTYPLLTAIYRNDIKVVEKIMNYANDKVSF